MKVFFLLSALLLWSACCEARMTFAGGITLGAGANCDNRKDATVLYKASDEIRSEHPEDSATFNVTRVYKSDNENCKITCFRMTDEAKSYSFATLEKVNGGVGSNFVKVLIFIRKPVMTFNVEMYGICQPNLSAPATPSAPMPSVSVTDAEPEMTLPNSEITSP